MATAADDSTGYGGGAGGKFRKRPLRRPQATPYDRPPAAVRFTRKNNDNSSSGGWLSRIVDPASKLITASAHKLFSSVFRKRLLAPPSQTSQGEEVEPSENHLGDAIIEAPSRIQERDMIEKNTQSGSMMDGIAELEHIFKQKTFTRSEIDHLTELLHSRKVDKTAADGQRRFELTPSERPTGHSRQKELLGTAFENGFNRAAISGIDLNPAVRSNVNVDGVASPTDLAKSYMGRISTRASPSTLGPPSQALREETPANTTLQLHRPSVSSVQKSLNPVGTLQKDFVVPRSRGRSAIYSMARAPYSRLQPAATKVIGTSNDAFNGQSSSPSQKVLKRRSSVLENGIGAVGPIRRIRQKPNLLYPKTSDLRSSYTPFTNGTPSGVGEASSSKSHEGRGEKGPLPSSHVSSKSIEIGQRILQELDKLTPTKEKSNERKPGIPGGISGMELTPSMLSGQARKSLETLDSLKYVQSNEVGGKMVDSFDAVREVQDSTAKEQDKFFDSSSKVFLNSSSKVYPENDEARIADNDAMAFTKITAPVFSTFAVDVPKRSPAFQMSAYEDYLDLDDDVHLNEVALPSVNEGERNPSASSVQSNGKLPEHPSFAEATKADKPTFPGVEASSDSMLKNAAAAVDASNTAEKGISHNFTNSVLNKTIGSSIPSLQPVITSVSDKADTPASTVNFGIKSSDRVSSPSVVESSIPKDVISSVLQFGAASMDPAIKSPGSNNKSIEAVDLCKKSDNPQTVVSGSSASTVSPFGSFPLTSAVPSPALFSSQSSSSGISAQSTFSTSIAGVSDVTVGADAVSGSATATAPIGDSSKSLTNSVSFPSFQTTFGGSSAASDSATLATSSSDSATLASGADTAGQSKQTAVGNSSSSYLSGAATSSFQFGAPKTSVTNSQSQASTTSTHSIFGDQILPSTIASATECAPSQPTAASGPASSVSSSLPMNSGSLALASAPLSSSSAFGSSFSGSSSTAISTSVSSASTNIFGGSPQPTSPPVFGSAFSNSSSSGFAFGVASSTSAPANGSSAVAPFGSSSTSTASSSSPSLSFGASAPSGTVSSGFTFGKPSISAPANGSSNGPSFGASSTPAASGSSSPSVFGFGASSSASSSTPSSTFSFAASSTPASSIAPSSTFSFGASASSSAPSSSSASSSSPSSTFSFGASPTPASSTVPTSTFSFGASSSSPSSTFSFGASPISTASSSAPSSTFSFGVSSASASSTAPSTFLFGASSASTTTTATTSFPFGSAASTPAPNSIQPTFGNASSVFGFGSTPSGNNDQMSMEDSMVEDSMNQSPTIATPTPVFGQNPPASSFSFGMAQAQAAPSPAPLGASPFQFGGQQNQVAAPPNPFQASGSFDGGSFSLGAGGNDKSNRRIVKVNKGRNRKK